MKKIILSIAICISIVSYGQKVEISNAEKSYNKGEYAQALQNIEEAEKLIASAPMVVKPEDKIKAMYIKAMSLYKQGDNAKSLPLFSQIIAFEKGINYSARKIADKIVHYFDNEQELDKAIAQGDFDKKKISKCSSKYTTELSEILRQIAVNSQNKGVEAFNANDFASAAILFEQAYDAQASFSDKPDTSLISNSAISMIRANDYNKAAEYYKKLLKMGYTGIQTLYKAVNVETGQERYYPTQKDMDAEVKLGLAKDPQIINEPNKQADIYLTLIQILYQEGQIEECVEYCRQAQALFPDKKDFYLIEAQSFYDKKDFDSFLKVMDKAMAQDPNNVEYLFNYGIVLSEKGDKKGAREYFEKAISINNRYTNAYLNLINLILEPEKEINDQIDKLPYNMNKAQAKKYEELKEKKKALYKEAEKYLLKAYESDPKNLQVVSTLKNIYYQINDKEAYDKFDKIEKEL